MTSDSSLYYEFQKKVHDILNQTTNSPVGPFKDIV